MVFTRRSPDSSRSDPWARIGSKPLSGTVYAEIGREELGGMSYDGGIYLSWRPDQKIDVSLRLGLSRTEGWVLHHEDREMGEFDTAQFNQSLRVSYYPRSRQPIQRVVSLEPGAR